MDEKFRKFLAFEWIMLVIFGFFWGGAMCFVLFITQSLENKGEFWNNCFIVGGLYLIYLACRICYLLYRSLRWAYLVSNFLFKSEKEKRFAEEWILVVLLCFLWSVVIAFPLYYVGVFSEKSWPFAIILMVTPYTAFVAGRWAVRSVVWSTVVLNEKKPRAKG